MRKILLGLAICAAAVMPLAAADAYYWTGNKWPQGNPTYVDVTITGSIPSAWRSPFTQAMSEWNNAGARFLFRASSSSGHDVALKYLWFEDALAVTRVREGIGSRTTYDRDVDFNSKYSWDVNGAANKYDAWGTMTHELGHWLTLGDLYSSADYLKTMYGGTALGITYHRTLHSDDIAGARSIYGIR